MLWTEPRKDRLRKMIGDGLTRVEIAYAMSEEAGETVSASAIGGQCHRMGLKLLAHDIVVQSAKTRPLMRRAPKPLPVVASPRLVPACEPVFAPLNVTLLENDGCRFITAGEGATALYCGHGRVPDTSWCSHHAAIVFQPRGAKVEADDE